MSGSWGSGDQLAYDPSKHYCQHSDRRGHSVEIRLRLPTPIASQVGDLVAGRQISEYRKAADFIADAVVHHLHRIGEELGSQEIRKVVNLQVVYDDARRKETERAIFEELLVTIDRNCQAFYPSAGGTARWEGLREYCNDLLDREESLPAEMRDRYRDTIHHHLKNAGGL